MSIVPRGLFDQIYGIDLGNMGAPVEPGIPGNPIPYLINSEIPTTSDGIMRIPPEVVDAASMVNVDDNPENQPAGPTEYYDTETPLSDTFPDLAMLGVNPNVVDAVAVNPTQSPADRVAAAQLAGLQATPSLPSRNPARNTPSLEVTPPAQQELSVPEVQATPQTAINDPISAIVGALPSLNTQNVVDAAVMSVPDVQSPNQVSLSSSTPASVAPGSVSMSGVASGVSNATPGNSAISGVASGVSNTAPSSVSTQSNSVGGLEADMNAANAVAEGNYNAAVAEQEAMNQIANLGVNQRSLNNTIGQDIISSLANQQSNQALAQSVQQSLADIASRQANQQTNQQAANLANAMQGLPATPNTADEVSTESQMSSVGPTVTPSSVTTSSMAAPGANPGNVGNFASRSLGVAQANQALADQQSRTQQAEQGLNQARADVARSNGFAPGLANALASRNSSDEEEGNETTGNSTGGFSPISDDPLGGLGLGPSPSLAPEIGPPQSSTAGTAQGFVSGLFGTNPDAQNNFSNPPIDLDTLVQQELNNPSYDPFRSTGVQTLGSLIGSQNTSGATPDQNARAENDAMNEAGGFSGLDSNIDNSPTTSETDSVGRSGKGLGGGTIGGPTQASLGTPGTGNSQSGSIGGNISGIGGLGGLGGLDSDAAQGADGDGADSPSDGIGAQGGLGGNDSDAVSGVDGDQSSSVGGVGTDTEGGVGQGLGGEQDDNDNDSVSDSGNSGIGGIGPSGTGSIGGVEGSGVGAESGIGVGVDGHDVGADITGSDDTGVNDVSLVSGVSSVAPSTVSISGIDSLGAQSSSSVGGIGSSDEGGSAVGEGPGGSSAGDDTGSPSDPSTGPGSSSSAGAGPSGSSAGDDTGVGASSVGEDPSGATSGDDTSGPSSSVGEGPGGSSAGDDTGGPGDASGDGADCVISTHGIKTGGMTRLDRAKAEVWCQRNLHGYFVGETIRRGYRILGNRAIERGEAQKHYGEFNNYVATARGLKRDLRSRAAFALRTAQFFVVGLFWKED